MFSKLLIANRGEIAVRVIRACREMGIEAVAVYSEADREALHVRLADEAYPIGPPPARESYLSIERIIGAAKRSHAEAIHPGYGFLSENPLLPEACEAAGIVFIGPGAAAMRFMGNKVSARAAMVAAGVPVTPGTDILPEDPGEARAICERVIAEGVARASLSKADAARRGSSQLALPDNATQTSEQAQSDPSRGETGGGGSLGGPLPAKARMRAGRGKEAPGFSGGVRDDPAGASTEADGARADSRAGNPYPMLLKAAAGGGGKGMRVVTSPEEFPSAYAQARSEGLSSFGDASVYAEKLVTRPRHIEVQVLADLHGATVHLGERECSIQRRHQKLVEECPSPVVDAATRARIGELAVRAARAAGYAGAGTCEFLRDENGAFYFMEMNARLQVEHPVTEMVTGLDLVKLQIRIAAGEPLPFGQSDLAMRGWAIECRIFAEDPLRNFMPSPGRIGTLRVPAGPGIRDDGGVYQGYRVPVHYDPMISKLIAWGESREEAIARMRRALDEYRIEGIRTTIPFHRRLVRHPAFLAGDIDTSFIEHYRDELIPRPLPAPSITGREGSAPAATADTEGRRSVGSAAGTEVRAKKQPPGERARAQAREPEHKAAGDRAPGGKRRAEPEAPQATGRAPSELAASVSDSDATGGTLATRPRPVAESTNGRALSTREIAVLAASIVFLRKAESGLLGRTRAEDAPGGVEGAPKGGFSSGIAMRRSGWKIASRLEGLRDR